MSRKEKVTTTPKDRGLNPEIVDFLYQKQPTDTSGPKHSKQVTITSNLALQKTPPSSSTNTSVIQCSHTTADLTYPSRLPLFQLNSKYSSYFDYVHHADPNKVVVKCKLDITSLAVNNTTKQCDQTLNITVGNYCNLKRHLESVHNQLISLTKNQTSATGETKNDRQAEFDDIVLEMYSEGLPFSFVRRKSFIRMVRTLNPRIKVKSRTTYTRNLNMLVKNSVRPHIQKTLMNTPTNGTHFTVDLWTTRSRKGAMGVKTHFISADWEHKVLTIALTELSESHTAENIKEKFDRILDSFEFNRNKLGLVISDNAVNMKKAFDLTPILKRLQLSTATFLEDSHSDEVECLSCNSDVSELEDESEDSEDSDDDDVASIADSTADVAGLGWGSCIAHSLQLGINDSLKSDSEVSEIIKTVHIIATFFRRSNKWEAVYRKEVNENCTCDCQNGHELKKPNTTRWNSTLFAIERMCKEDVFLTLQNVVRRIKCEKSTRDTNMLPRLPKVFHTQIQELTSLLKPLQILTDTIQSESTTSNIVTVAVITAYREILDVVPSIFDDFKRTLLNNVKKRLEPYLNDKWFILSAVLDPRQKMRIYTRLRWIDGSAKLVLPTRDIIQDHVESEMLRCEISLEQSDDSKRSDVEGPGPKRSKTDMFRLLDDIEESPHEEQSPLQEFFNYTAEPVEPKSTNPLMYWRNKQYQFPALASIAKIALSIPATSASVESLFSVAGALGNARRSKLGIEVVESLTLRRDLK